MVLGGDGRWFNKEAAQIIIKLAAGNGVGKIYVDKTGICNSSCFCVIRARRRMVVIMSASHTPVAEQDWGIKFNYSSEKPT